jgi:hypothetical protein
MDWYRSYHGAVSDDKWPLIARKSGQPVAVVVAIWFALLDCASQADDRGSVEAFDAESVDALFQLPDGATQSVVDALSCGKRPRIEGGRIVNWAKRQPLREREDEPSSADRVRQYRERRKAEQVSAEMTDVTDVTPCNASVTPRNAMKRQVTPVQHQETPRSDKIREEERREDSRVLKQSPIGDSSSPETGNDPAATEQPAPPEPPPCPHAEIVALYHELLPELPRMRTWEGNRKKHLAARWKETLQRLRKARKPHDRQAGLEWWRQFFLTRVRPSPWLMGQKKDWRATLDWLVRPENYAKTLDGQYLEKQSP